jgi:hypothetical protein
MRSVTSQGRPYARFRRALASGDALVATAAARELPRVGLDDALRLLLVYHHAHDRRFERAALRWHARLCAETPRLRLAEAATALQALTALARGDLEHGADALAGILEALDADELLAALYDSPTNTSS